MDSKAFKGKLGSTSLLLWMVLALVTKHIMKYLPSLEHKVICHLFHSNRQFYIAMLVHL